MSVEPEDLLRRLADTLSFATLLEEQPALKPADLRRLLRKSAELWEERRKLQPKPAPAPAPELQPREAPHPEDSTSNELAEDLEAPDTDEIQTLALPSPETVATIVVDVHIDGASKGNPGPSGIGVVLGEPGGIEFVAKGKFIGEGTNNEAEYRALLEALDVAEFFGFKKLRLHSDSQLLVRQIHGQYKVREPRIQRLFEAARTKLARFERVEVIHVPREENSRADELANQAVKAVLQRRKAIQKRQASVDPSDEPAL